MSETIEKNIPVVVNDDFSFIGEDGKTYSLQHKQKLFAECYLDFGGNGVEAIIEAGYDVNYKDKKGNDTGVPNRKLASVMAFENLEKPHIFTYINSKLEEFGFSDNNVEKQHLFLLNQQADMKTKAKAIDMFYKVKGKYPKNDRNVTNNTLNVFSLADLAHKSTIRKNNGLPPVTLDNLDNNIKQLESETVTKPLQDSNEPVTKP